MLKQWFYKIKKQFLNWWDNFKQNKLNLYMLVFVVLFVLFGALSWVLPMFTLVAFAFLLLATIMFAYHFQKKHRDNKRRFMVAMHKQMLTEKEIKGIKRELRSIKFLFIALYGIAISLAYSIFQALSAL